MSLSDHVRTLGRGRGRSRSLTQSEAFYAMTAILSRDAAPEAVGVDTIIRARRAGNPS